MTYQDKRNTALLLIRSHGLHAQAIAQQHLAEMRQMGDTAEFERWQDIHAAICELRRLTTGHASPTNTGAAAA